MSEVRDRASIVLIENNKVVLIKRNRDGCIYYVFPGGGIEYGEIPESAAKREAFEELGVHISIKKHLETIEYHGKNFFFLADITGGSFGTGQGEEYMEKSIEMGTYEPIWISLDELPVLNVKPREMVIKLKKLLVF